jgi:hypothetical protein
MFYEFGIALTKLTWFEMNKVATHIAEATNGHAQNGENVDPHFVSDLLLEIGEGIVKETECKAASIPRNAQPQ